jgi:hypothetical protein
MPLIDPRGGDRAGFASLGASVCIFRFVSRLLPFCCVHHAVQMPNPILAMSG